MKTFTEQEIRDRMDKAIDTAIRDVEDFVDEHNRGEMFGLNALRQRFDRIIKYNLDRAHHLGTLLNPNEYDSQTANSQA